MLQADDLLVTASARGVLMPYMLRALRISLDAYGSSDDKELVSFYGANPIDGRLVRQSLEDVHTTEEATNTARWAIKAYEHVDYVVKNPDKFLPLFSESPTTQVIFISYAGMKVRWSIGKLSDIIRVKARVMEQLLSDVAEPVEDARDSGRVYWTPRDVRWNDAFISDASKPVLQRAMFLAKRDMLEANSWRGHAVAVSTNHNGRYVFGYVECEENSAVVDAYVQMTALVKGMQSAPDIDAIKSQRSKLLRMQAQAQAQQAEMRKQLTSNNFSAFWDSMKSTMRSRVADVDQTARWFSTIPLQPTDTQVSRTWGIEVETVQAELVDRPNGWKSEYDGSLTDSEQGSCDCSCDECYNSDHCDDHSEDCYNSSGGSSREFVSPILHYFNSRGLQNICSALPDDEDDDSPGIHVHVDGGDLTVTDVARLLVSYSIVQPLLEPLYHRTKDYYCKETASDAIKWWLGAARKYTQETGTVPVPRDICDQMGDRYRDVNVHALSKHGTIEFRSMGPYYNYDHLVRWAWVVRELVNVSKLGLPQTTWTKCGSLLDVIAVLRKYGSEMPSDKLMSHVDSTNLVLQRNEQ